LAFFYYYFYWLVYFLYLVRLIHVNFFCSSIFDWITSLFVFSCLSFFFFLQFTCFYFFKLLYIIILKPGLTGRPRTQLIRGWNWVVFMKNRDSLKLGRPGKTHWLFCFIKTSLFWLIKKMGLTWVTRTLDRVGHQARFKNNSSYIIFFPRTSIYPKSYYLKNFFKNTQPNIVFIDKNVLARSLFNILSGIKDVDKSSKWNPL
jgi:hypothetical protein